MKLVILLLFLGMIVPVFAQELSFDEQLASSEEYAKLLSANHELKMNLEELENTTNRSNFLESLATVVIPVLVGGGLTYKLSHSWQSYRYKINIKKQLMSVFHEYAYVSHYRLELFMRQFLEKYSSNENLDQLLSTGDIYHTFKTPTPEDLPKIVLKTEYEELLKLLFDGYKLRTNLNSLLRLYANTDDLIKQLDIISKHNGFDYALIKKIIKLENFDEFQNLFEEHYKKYKESEDLIVKFERELADLKIRKIPS